jgi:hypothetical protein
MTIRRISADTNVRIYVPGKNEEMSPGHNDIQVHPDVAPKRANRLPFPRVLTTLVCAVQLEGEVTNVLRALSMIMTAIYPYKAPTPVNGAVPTAGPQEKAKGACPGVCRGKGFVGAGPMSTTILPISSRGSVALITVGVAWHGNAGGANEGGEEVMEAEEGQEEVKEKEKKPRKEKASAVVAVESAGVEAEGAGGPTLPEEPEAIFERTVMVPADKVKLLTSGRKSPVNLISRKAGVRIRKQPGAGQPTTTAEGPAKEPDTEGGAPPEVRGSVGHRGRGSWDHLPGLWRHGPLRISSEGVILCWSVLTMGCNGLCCLLMTSELVMFLLDAGRRSRGG